MSSKFLEHWIHIRLMLVVPPRRCSNIWANKWITKRINPTLCLGTWNKFSLELCKWSQNLVETRHGHGPGRLPCHDTLWLETWLYRQIGRTWMKMAYSWLLDTCAYRQGVLKDKIIALKSSIHLSCLRFVEWAKWSQLRFLVLAVPLTSSAFSGNSLNPSESVSLHFLCQIHGHDEGSHHVKEWSQSVKCYYIHRNEISTSSHSMITKNSCYLPNAG